jgi:hypothetical protein
MTRRLLDYNPITGEKVWFDYGRHDDRMVITHEQDVSTSLDYSHARATDEIYTSKGIRNDMWHYARVPNIVILEMKSKHGVDFYDRNHAKRVFELLETEYAYCKTTTKHHGVR